MRSITDHVTNPVNDRIQINTLDDPGSGGANHVYKIGSAKDDWSQTLRFQNGPIGEVGVNGVTQEVLLAIVVDRLRSFQAGPFSCVENKEALGYAQAALDALKKRTMDRVARNVEGRSVA